MRAWIVVAGFFWCASANAQVTWGQVRGAMDSANCTSSCHRSAPSQYAAPDIRNYFTARSRINLMIEHALCEGEPAYYMPRPLAPSYTCTPIAQATVDLWSSWRDGGASAVGGPNGSTADVVYASTWCDSVTPPKPGIQSLLMQNCTGSCHNGSLPEPTTSAQPPKWPQWLDFTQCETLLMSSYYMPGHTKAEASIARSDDGTMPPGLPPGFGLSPNQKAALRDFFLSAQPCSAVCP